MYIIYTYVGGSQHCYYAIHSFMLPIYCLLREEEAVLPIQTYSMIPTHS